MRDIKTSTESFEEWLGAQLKDLGGCDRAALAQKKVDMKEEGPHAFLRGTFYRWAELWQDRRPEGSVFPVVGDTHVENFGTWRDEEGRLVWGVNDFDETCKLPWCSDLVRLGVSAKLSLGELGHFQFSWEDACSALWKGYRDVVSNNFAEPLVLQEKNDGLGKLIRKLILSKAPDKFWEKRLAKLVEITEYNVIPAEARRALLAALPPDCKDQRYYQPKDTDQPGMGSRGKRRYYVMAMWKGAYILRETKPVVPSALAWANGGADPGSSLRQMLELRVRCPDPSHKVYEDAESHKEWAVRRLAPDSSKIELKDLDGGVDKDMKSVLFNSMGAELANLHLGFSQSNTNWRSEIVDRDRSDWLTKEVEDWTKKIEGDFAEFQASVAK